MLSLTVALGACASRYEWGKEGAGAGEIDSARRDCKEESRGYGFLDGPNQSMEVPTAAGARYSNLTAKTALRESDIYGDCMRAKGYELAPVKDE